MVYQGGETTDGRRIYVGNINYDCREEEIRNAFNEFGQITALSYKQGFAFVDFADSRDAQDAIQSMNTKQLAGRTITVELSGRPPKEGAEPPRRSFGGTAGGDSRDSPRARYDDYRSDQRGAFGGTGGGNSRDKASSDAATKNLFVGNIPPDVTEQDVNRHFSKFGHVTAVKFLPKKSDTIAAFVDFGNVDDARDAHDAHNELGGMKLRTDYNNRRSAAPQGAPPPRDDDRYGRGPPPPRYDDRGPPPPRYDDRYDDRAPPPPRYDDRYDDRGPPPPRYDDRGAPPPRYEDRRYDDRAPPPPRYDDRYDDRAPPPRSTYDRGPPPPRYDDRYDDRAPPPPRYDERERDYYADRGGGYARGPPPPSRYDEPSRYDDRGPPPPRYDERDYGRGGSSAYDEPPRDSYPPPER